MLLEAGWNYGLLELDFLLWLVTFGLLPWVHLPLHVPLCWECRLLLPLACFPHIAGVAWVKLSNSLLSVCDAGWCVAPGPLVGSLFWWLFPAIVGMGLVWVCLLVCWNWLCILASLCWFCAALGLMPSRLAEAAAMGRPWRLPLLLLPAALLGLCLFGWGSLPNVQTV